MPDIVNGLLLDHGKVLLAQRSETRASYAGTWSFPGGHVEQGETLDDGLCRELMEEIGILPLLWERLENFRYNSGKVTFHFFVVSEWRGEVSNLGHEHRELRWVDLRWAGKMPNLTFPIYARIFASLA